MAEDTKAFQQLLQKNLLFHIIIENEVRLTPFGQITFNVIVKNGVIQTDTLNIVKSKRKKYKLDKKEKI